jgi:UDP-2,3-diacylglucosamine hydrolase
MGTYFTADAHLGGRCHSDPRAVELRIVRWLESIEGDAEAVWFLGDTFDYWFEYRYVVPKGYVRFLGKLAEMADAGTEVHFLTGNHDVWLFGYLSDELGATIHRSAVITEIHGATFFLAHGDEADDSLNYRLLRSLFHSRFCQRLYGGIHPRWAAGLARHWSYRSRASHGERREESLLPYVKFAEAVAGAYPEVDYIVMGHLHRAADRQLAPPAATPRLLILGDWLTAPTCLRQDEQGLTQHIIP